MMKNLKLHMASLVLTGIALIPAASLADDDLDVTMEVFDSLADVEGVVLDMPGQKGSDAVALEDGDHDGNDVDNDEHDGGFDDGDHEVGDDGFEHDDGSDHEVGDDGFEHDDEGPGGDDMDFEEDRDEGDDVDTDEFDEEEHDGEDGGDDMPGGDDV